MPSDVDEALAAWRAAERDRDHYLAGSPEWRVAVITSQTAHAIYLEAVARHKREANPSATAPR